MLTIGKLLPHPHTNLDDRDALSSAGVLKLAYDFINHVWTCLAGRPSWLAGGLLAIDYGCS